MQNDNVCAFIINYLSKHLEIPTSAIDATRSFEDAGADSITLVELAMELEQTYDISVPDGTLTTEGTITSAAEELVALPARQNS